MLALRSTGCEGAAFSVWSESCSFRKICPDSPARISDPGNPAQFTDSRRADPQEREVAQEMRVAQLVPVARLPTSYCAHGCFACCR